MALGHSDHNVVFLLPHYKSELKPIKPHIHSATLWSEDAITQPQGSVACTNLDIFQGGLDHKVSLITDYIKFCIFSTIPTRAFRRFPDSKPWITSHIKSSLKGKHMAFQHKNWTAVNLLNRQIRNDIIRSDQHLFPLSRKHLSLSRHLSNPAPLSQTTIDQLHSPLLS